MIAGALALGFGARASAETLHADFDGDRLPDIVTITPARSQELVIRLSTSGLPSRFVTPHPVERLLAADIDLDGDIDLLALAAGQRPLYWINAGDGRFTRHDELLPQRLGRSTTGVDDRAPSGRSNAAILHPDSHDALLLRPKDIASPGSSSLDLVLNASARTSATPHAACRAPPRGVTR